MSPLWNILKKKQKTSHKDPSPKDIILVYLFFRIIPHKQVINDSIEETSVPISFQFDSEKLKGGMTLEAALLLPLFIFFFLNLCSAFEMIRLHENLEWTMCTVGNEISVLGDMSESDDGEVFDKVNGIMLSYLYIKQRMISELGKDYLENTVLANGTDSLHFFESNIVDENDCIDLKLTYQVNSFGGLVKFVSFRMCNRYYSHLWTGYKIPYKEDDITVYVTETGQVYHKTLDCSYLNLSIREMALSDAKAAKNKSGGSYYMCELCGDGKSKSLVYITESGNAIHLNRECPGLKRSIHSILLSQAKEYGACHRCAK